MLLNAFKAHSAENWMEIIYIHLTSIFNEKQKFQSGGCRKEGLAEMEGGHRSKPTADLHSISKRSLATRAECETSIYEGRSLEMRQSNFDGQGRFITP